MVETWHQLLSLLVPWFSIVTFGLRWGVSLCRFYPGALWSWLKNMNVHIVHGTEYKKCHWDVQKLCAIIIVVIIFAYTCTVAPNTIIKNIACYNWQNGQLFLEWYPDHIQYHASVFIMLFFEPQLTIVLEAAVQYMYLQFILFYLFFSLFL